MPWSTRELAELTGTTLKTVRHYHRIGLLAEPDRAPNGYKRYRVEHVVRLLRIRRLVDLGVPLSDIPVVEESGESAEQTLRALDAELAASIERQQRMRDELARILRQPGLVELPPGFEGDAAALSDADRALLMLYSTVLDAPAMTALQAMQAMPREPVEARFDALPADADEDTRQRLAEEYAPTAWRQLTNHPALADEAASKAFAKPVVLHGLVELYNHAQIDVLQRINKILGLSSPDAGTAKTVGPTD